MADGLIIKVGADVGGAISGLNQVDQAVNKTTQGFSKLPAVTNQSTMAITNLSRVVQDAPYGFIGIANNINPLIESFQRLKLETNSTKGAFSALANGLAGPGGFGLAIAAITTAITFAQIGFQAWFKSSKEAKSANDEFGDSVKKTIKDLDDYKAKLDQSTESYERFKASREKNVKLSFGDNLKTELLLLQGQGLQLQKEIYNNQKAIDATFTAEDKLWNDYFNKRKDDYGRLLVTEEQYNAGRAKLQTERFALQKKQNELESKGYDQVATIKLKEQQIREDDSKKYNEYINNIINQAKKLSNETKGIIDLRLNIRTLDEKEIAFKKAKEFIDAYQQGLYKLTIAEPLKSIEPQTEFSDEKIKSDAFDAGNLYGDIFARAAEHKMTGIDFTVVEIAAKKLLKSQDVLDQLGQDTASAFYKGFMMMTEAGFAQVGEIIGTALGGGDIKNAFQGFVTVIGEGLSAIGKQLIHVGVVALFAKQSLKKLFENPALAIAAGVALIAAGTTMKTAISSGLPGRATGGPVSGNSPYMVGERGPELFVPSVSGTIIPNNRIGAMGGRAINMGGGNGRTIIRGNDIILSYARASRSQSRVNG